MRRGAIPRTRLEQDNDENGKVRVKHQGESQNYGVSCQYNFVRFHC